MWQGEWSLRMSEQIVMQPRIEYAKAAPGAMTAMLGLEAYVRHCGLEVL